MERKNTRTTDTSFSISHPLGRRKLPPAHPRCSNARSRDQCCGNTFCDGNASLATQTRSARWRRCPVRPETGEIPPEIGAGPILPDPPERAVARFHSSGLEGEWTSKQGNWSSQISLNLRHGPLEVENTKKKKNAKKKNLKFRKILESLEKNRKPGKKYHKQSIVQKVLVKLPAGRDSFGHAMTAYFTRVTLPIQIH